MKLILSSLYKHTACACSTNNIRDRMDNRNVAILMIIMIFFVKNFVNLLLKKKHISFFVIISPKTSKFTNYDILIISYAMEKRYLFSLPVLREYVFKLRK